MRTLHFKIQYRPVAELMVYLVVGLITLFPLWAYSVWPINHEGLSFFSRLHVYQQHFQAGDFLPIWSSLDNHGFGSPQPLFYHKLFYFVSTAFLYVFSGNLKVALITAVCFFLIVGAWGTRKLVLEIGGSAFAAFCAGLMMLLANYTVTDWLVRGGIGRNKRSHVSAMGFSLFSARCSNLSSRLETRFFSDFNFFKPLGYLLLFAHIFYIDAALVAYYWASE